MSPRVSKIILTTKLTGINTVVLKSSIPIGAKFEISPEGFTLGVTAETEKIFSICPKLLMNTELYGLVLAPQAEKKDTIEANLQP
jgi:hypothetical protein